jgi:hypothetical protein
MKSLLIYCFSFLILVFTAGISSNNTYAFDQSLISSSSLFSLPNRHLLEGLFKNTALNVNINTAIPNFNFLDIENFSLKNVLSIIKAIGALAINLFLIVIQATVEILKVLLPFLN